MSEWNVETSSLRPSGWEGNTFATCNVVTLDTKTEKDVTVEGRSSGANSNEAIDVISRLNAPNTWLSAISLKGCRDARFGKFQLQSFQCYSCCTHKLRINEVRKTTQSLSILDYSVIGPGFELAMTWDTSQSRLENLHMQDGVLRERTSVPLFDASGGISMCIANSASTPNSAKLRR
ncbi:hypothetical protein COCSADRAFT_30547 [Bipolaris sorokiniana ND90Pr]|uniref:Uncharacterized protein n=1 Tax=Cochliobolus sativus (strain ND90Pr / ATCC 201652) TaxID=665912 RepID=M2SRR7_COCSN|nr:uncharacterized protein COCSADRAFT_30547 [Bipolaris sorokiniana ND90Pr]EMD59781.1 hypothetical protein COCSADRAFT_30547 [Bipolaris sorokiniana ND90Pr]